MYFDYAAELLRGLPQAASRRGVFAGFASGLCALIPAAADAKRNGKRKRKRHGKRKKQHPQTPGSPSPGPVIRTDAICAGAGNTGLGSTDGNTRLAQTFTALANGALVRAELPLVKQMATDGEYILRLSPLDGLGVPTNDLLAVSAVSNLSVPAGPSLVTFAFANPPAVIAGTQYALVLTRPGSTHLQWVGDFDLACPGRSFVSTDQSAPFVATGSGVDLLFTVFVKS